MYGCTEGGRGGSIDCLVDVIEKLFKIIWDTEKIPPLWNGSLLTVNIDKAKADKELLVNERVVT